MSKNRRVAIICGGLAGAIPCLVGLGRGHGSSDSWVGFAAGVLVGVALVAFVKLRKA